MKWTIALSALVLLCLPACSHHYGGFQAGPVDPQFLPRFQAKGDVAVKPAAQAVPDDVLFCSKGGHSHYASANELAGVAVAVAKDILRQNNATSNDNASKTLTISFARGDCGGVWTLGVDLVILVQAGDGPAKEFKGHQEGIVVIQQMNWAIESAISYAVIDAFKDPDILAYLQK